MHKKIFAVFYMLFSGTIFLLVMRNSMIQNVVSDIIMMKEVETTVETAFPGKAIFREIYGFTNRIISPNEIAAGGRATNKDKNGVIIEIPYVSDSIIPEAINNIVEFNCFGEKTGTDFVYISYPSKINSDITVQNYGIETNSEERR